MGSDMLLQFQNWYRWQELLTMTELGVIARETDDRAVLEQAAQELSAYGTNSAFAVTGFFRYRLQKFGKC